MLSIPQHLVRATSLCAVALSFSLVAPAQTPAPSVELSYHHASELAENTSARAEVVISFPVIVEGAPWMRLSFSEIDLSGELFAGTGSLLRITSLRDGAVQELNALHVSQWQQTSAYFNGDMVLVEVLAQPGTGLNRVVLDSVTAGEIPSEDTQCGPNDDRVLSSDPRAARIMPITCSGWMIDDCSSCFLTAGHCDGNMQTVQFNVPLSTSGGALVSPSPDDQYAVDATSVQSNGGQGTGNDWAYFGVFPNSNTGLTPFEAQGARYTVDVPPPFNPSENIRITGYGADGSPQENNHVQQTHVGPWATSTGSLLQYVTDTEGGNSGSPVIHEESGVAIGIHTHGGCDPDGTGQNSGTSLSHTGLQAALADPQGVCEGSINLAGALPQVLQPGVAEQLVVQVSGSFAPGSVTLHARLDGGLFAAQAMTDLGGGLFGGSIVVGSCADTPEYFFSVDNTVCGTLTTPGNAPSTFYSSLSGTPTTVLHDDFEANLGWTATNLGATSGDWERGVPVNDPGWAYDPASDSDGSGQAYLTANAVGNTDVDDGAVQLESPSIDMTGGGVVVSYDYFLNLTDSDGTDRLLVEAGSGGSFSEVTRHDEGGALTWRNQVLTEADFTAAGVTLTSATRMRFTANDGDAQSIVEAGLDAFDVSRLTCGPVGETYCTSNGATISASGSASLADNDLTLTATGVPADKNGIFIYSMTQQSTPFGQGTRCVGPSLTVRLQPLTSSGPGGVLTAPVDYGALAPAGTILAGDTWNFQAWFRAGGGTFDLSDAVSITFTE